MKTVKLHRPKLSNYDNGWVGATICWLMTAGLLMAALGSIIAAIQEKQAVLLIPAMVGIGLFGLAFWSQFIWDGKD